MDSIRVLIADDHTLFRQGLRALLTSLPEIEVVGEAATGQQAVDLAAELQPDVVLMDLRFDEAGLEMNGIEATRQLARLVPGTGVIVVTMQKNDDAVFAAIKAGARGYVLKGADQTELLQAMQAIMNGGMLFGPSIAARVVNSFNTPQPAFLTDVFPELNTRERQVLDLMAQGMDNKQIAHQLSVSEKRVRNVCSDIYSKLHVRDRIEAVIRAREAGMGQGQE